jgi:hypothetical protein
VDEPTRKAPLMGFSTISDVAQQNRSTEGGHERNKKLKT